MIQSTTYQYGIVDGVEVSRDGKSRKAVIRYRNHNETFDRTTYRSVRKLIMIHPFDELDISQDLYECTTAADFMKMRNDQDM